MSTGTSPQKGPSLFPNTPAPKKEAPQGQAHQTKVTGVNSRTFDSGAKAITIDLESLNTGKTFGHMLFLPDFFVENVKIDPSTLSKDKIARIRTNAEGEEQAYEGQSLYQQYCTKIQNDQGTGELESLFNVAAAQGRAEGTEIDFNDFDELVELLGKVLPDTEFVTVFKPDTNPRDPAFADQLRPRQMLNPVEKDGTATIDNPKRFKGLRKMWEQ